MKIEKETTLNKIIEHLERREVLERHGLPCLHCPLLREEMSFLKIGDLAKRYKLDLEKILEELNNIEE